MAVTVERERIRTCLKQFDFRRLFVEELGWDNYGGAPLTVMANGAEWTLRPVAQKRDFAVLRCDPDANGGIPDYATRRTIETQARKLVHEHLIIYADRDQTMQVWQWVRRTKGAPTASRELRYFAGNSGEALVQRLRQLAIDIGDEETLTILDVARRVSGALDVDRVTKRFYDRFKSEHEKFLGAIEGIGDGEQRAWYASLMLNRLMFAYFIQRQGFLAGDQHYLRNRLALVRARYGPDQFDRFYREFLLAFFHHGLGEPAAARSPEVAALIGDIPYVNGGLFEVHKIEDENKSIAIPDAAFERVFDFFDAYDWHLDERPLRADNEINPDVLGYIFEKYINQKQMGAYYTKEDITGYIGRNTIVPYLLDAARKDCAVAFAPDGEVWRLLRDDPDAYIYEAVRRGVDEPLPPEIAAGLDDVTQRGGWNRPADPAYALPTETWREHAARRTRCLDLREKLAAGEITQVNDLITYNLDIERFALDAIERCEGPELLRAFWKALTSITILDPTCGSGAFLFAALNILEPLYAACLDRMQAFVAGFERLGETRRAPDFKETLARVAQHPNRRYYVLKTIIVNNLYGVDIMEEACEIAKLRLFLKLVAQVEDAARLEPLPDIDFNIRAGNTLVGFATLDAVRHAMQYGSGTQMKMLMPEDEETLRRIDEAAENAARQFKNFQDQQTTHGGEVTHADKAELQRRLAELSAELDRYLAREYGVDPDDLFAYGPWRKRHQPFHWFVEFYGIVHSRGGFDVIIGNPPWVEYRKIVEQYTVIGFASLTCNNLWAYVTERSISLLGRQGLCGLVVPMSLTCGERMAPIQDVIKQSGISWISSYESDTHPGQLFDGVEQNVSILLHGNWGRAAQHTTRLYRFFSEARDWVFFDVHYATPVRRYFSFGFPKVSDHIELDILDRLFARAPLGTQMVTMGGKPIYVHRIAHYYIKCFDFVPYFRSSRDGVKKSEDYKSYLFRPPVTPTVAEVNSSTFYFYWQVSFDSFKAGKQCVESFPCGEFTRAAIRDNMASLGQELMENMKHHARRLRARYSATGDVEYDQFFPRQSKPIIDEIDRVLAEHYGFTAEELDFIVNYDIKYRMGAENGEEAEVSE